MGEKTISELEQELRAATEASHQADEAMRSARYALEEARKEEIYSQLAGASIFPGRTIIKASTYNWYGDKEYLFSRLTVKWGSIHMIFLPIKKDGSVGVREMDKSLPRDLSMINISRQLEGA